MVRASLAAVSMINFFNFIFVALFLLYATRVAGGPARPARAVLGAGAVGGVLGSPLTRLSARVGVGRAYLVGCMVYPVRWCWSRWPAVPHLLVLGDAVGGGVLSRASG